MMSLFENNPKTEMFHKKVLDDVRKMSFEVDALTLVKVIDNYNCDVVVKDPKGYRSYRVSLEKNSRFTHFYRIHDVKGQKLVSPYQWKAKI